jgi:hypothetical protein
MKKYGLLISVFIVAAVYSTPAQQGCGPTPNIPTAQQQNMQQSQEAQKARQIQQIQAQANFQEAMAKVQTQMRISQIQNSGNPQMQQQTQKSFQDQIQMLQQTYQQQLQALQRQ